MRLHAELRRKQSETQDENCIVTDIIELPESEYASLYQNLLRERDYLAERANMESFILTNCISKQSKKNSPPTI